MRRDAPMRRLFSAFGRAQWESVDRAYPSARAVCRIVTSNISYRSEPPGRDRWQTPQETWRLGHGDCEDFALLVLHLCRRSGISCIMRIYYGAGGSSAGHAVVLGRIERDQSWWISSNGVYERTDDPDAYIAFALCWKNSGLTHIDVGDDLLDGVLAGRMSAHTAVGLSSIGASGGYTNRCTSCDYPIPPTVMTCAQCNEDQAGPHASNDRRQ